VYRKARFPDHVIVFVDQPTLRELTELDLTVYGNPILSSRSRLSPLRNLKRTDTTRWHVAMAHGNVVRPDIVDPPRPIRPEDIGASGMDYVAMGDWHAYAAYSQGGVQAFYSGSPEPTALDQEGAGHVACVEMDEGGAQVHQERVGTISAGRVTVDVAGKSMPAIAEEVRAHANPNLMLKVTLSGLVGLGEVLDAEKLAQELGSDFYHVECSDQSHPQVASISAEAYPEELVVGKFVRLMQARIEEATDEAASRRAEQALQLGVALLQGKEVL
jgi:DNA repair exonuclease SbcCD nuclease subunit